MAPTYRAAVAQYKTEGTVGKLANGKVTTAMDVLQLNLNNYEKIVEKAAKEDRAQIIVFPEWGLFGCARWGLSPAQSRKLILPFAQSIPEVKTKILDHYDTHDEREIPNVVVKLAKIASVHRVVIVANVAEKINEIPMNNNENVRLYNTEVAISEDGTLLGKYHKMNPFFKKTFDRPPPTENPVIFKTNFGVEFGLFVCKDLFHLEPQGKLLKEGVRHFPYSVAMPNNWLSRLKFKQWAAHNNAILLVSNLGYGQSGVFGQWDSDLEFDVRSMSKDNRGNVTTWHQPRTKCCKGRSRYSVEEGYVVATVIA